VTKRISMVLVFFSGRLGIMLGAINELLEAARLTAIPMARNASTRSSMGGR